MGTPDATPALLWRVSFVAPADQRDAFAAAVEDGASAVATFETQPGGPWQVSAIVPGRPDRAAIEARLAVMAAALGAAAPAVAIEPIAETDWLAATRTALPPLRIGRFFVHGAHLAPRGPVDIEIDAGLAFGSGAHESTRGCLIAIDRLARRMTPRHVLDLGCGSGILAIAAAKVWRARVIAADVDPRAVATARENADHNRVGDRIATVFSDGFRNPALARGAPYDLIVANILAGPLIALAPAVVRHLAPGGRVVLSGLIARQERAVLAAYRARGLRLACRIALGNWRTLVLRGMREMAAPPVRRRRPPSRRSAGAGSGRSPWCRRRPRFRA